MQSRLKIFLIWKKIYKIPTSKHMSRFRGNMKNISYKSKIDNIATNKPFFTNIWGKSLTYVQKN
jgi:hypothetical protein